MKARTVLQIALPLALLAAAVAVFVRLDPMGSLTGDAPPVPPQLTIERTVIDDGGFHVTVRGGGPGPIEVVQVQVNDAYWRFEQVPSGAVTRGETVRVDIPFPWTRGEPHDIRLLTADGTTFDHTIEVAAPTPVLTAERLGGYGLVGLFVGVLPVALGMGLYPVLRRAGARGFGFALALTLGLLAYLFVDTLLAAFESAERAAPLWEANVLVWLIAFVSFVLIVAVGRRGGTPRGYALAGFLALGIGIHNLGEGLAIGGALAASEVALGTFLVLGFTLHNVTEGVGIVAPITREPIRPWYWLGLIALAGLPAVIGIWIGVRAVAPHWVAIFLAVGVGAIAQVLFEVGSLLWRAAGATAVRWSAASGFLSGVAAMYLTAFLVQA